MLCRQDVDTEISVENKWCIMLQKGQHNDAGDRCLTVPGSVGRSSVSVILICTEICIVQIPPTSQKMFTGELVSLKCPSDELVFYLAHSVPGRGAKMTEKLYFSEEITHVM